MGAAERLPIAFVHKMNRLLGPEAEQLWASYERGREQGLRANALKLDGAQLAALLPFPLEPVPWCEEGFAYREPAAPGKHPYHAAGLYYVQEPSAMFPAAALGAMPGERVLDLCAAPGGKTSQLACAMRGQGLLIANEIEPKRVRALSENVERFGITNCVVTNETPQRLVERFAGFFDRILVDAPCSGEGMFRKDPEAASYWSERHVAACAQTQAGLLDAAYAMLREGGVMVYSTCTFSPEENERTIAELLSRHPDLGMERLPHEYGVAPGVPAWGRGGGTPVRGLPIDGDAPDGSLSVDGDAPDGSLAIDSDSPAGSLSIDSDSPAGSLAIDIDPPAGSLSVDGDAAERSLPAHADVYGQLAAAARLWPHRLRGEGHFAAKLRKSGSAPAWRGPLSATDAGRQPLGWFQEFVRRSLNDVHWDNATFHLFGTHLCCLPAGCPKLNGLRVVRPGLHLGEVKKDRFEPNHALVLALPADRFRFAMELQNADDRAAAEAYLRGETLAGVDDRGWLAVTYGGFPLGWGKEAKGTIKNFYPKGLRRMSPA